MVQMRFPQWSLNVMSVLIMVIGLIQVNENSGLLPTVNLEPLLYAIVAMGIGLIIVIWFLYEFKLSETGPSKY
jgi:hypothetical protein